MKSKFSKHSMNLFYIPALFLMLAFVGLPLANAVRLSFLKWNGYSQNMSWLGIQNYADMFTDKYFRIAFFNTLLYGFGSTLIQNVLGLSYAIFLNTKFKGRTIVRTFIYLPIMIAGLVMGYIMYYFVQFDRGILNEILAWFGRPQVDWLADSKRASIIITLINGWQYVGISMVMYLAGLQNIPDMYYEAAQIDGVSTMQRFRHITLPLLVPAISSAVVINLIGGMKLFDIIIALTDGGPAQKTHSLSTYISYVYFRIEKAGYAAAIGVFMFFFIMAVAMVANRYFRKREVEY